ncbi:MerR family transcriptional regulator [Corynebacterium minutissimum]|uniref:HTH-type transcriptional regulator n=1 Tax=Corynebacterium minutissimum TaxID=38301 RepID=A0A2X4UBM0_9CORY|nr:MerR family transcriptional regulator [Corynebacterium minutissimum]KHO29453.1 regulatory protein [Corynebacterium minutissimum]QPS58868.1 MerR family transcriptional regulator [Corynebacterium minutissimum]QQA80342.1 MerR family transcriptional regulator [Corynebacterium minutissimum]SQH99995.1 HTH-type transcriptional regulator [Corynebacterium minutissimum]VEG05938.1 HTH-type transcriptional regulator [Corynebacterium minutissimum]
MKISDVAAVAGCSVRSVRHLHETGAVPEPARTSGNYRDYSVSDLASVLRARALIDAGVPIADVSSPDAVERSFNMLDERIARLQQQRERLRALSQAPKGTPEDIRDSLSQLIEDPAILQLELDSWDLMALTSVATPATWEQLRENLRDNTCLAALPESEMLWLELGSLSPHDCGVTRVVEKLRYLGEHGLMRGIYPTLQPGKAPLAVADAPATGAQGVALKALVGGSGG